MEVLLRCYTIAQINVTGVICYKEDLLEEGKFICDPAFATEKLLWWKGAKKCMYSHPAAAGAMNRGFCTDAQS